MDTKVRQQDEAERDCVPVTAEAGRRVRPRSARVFLVVALLFSVLLTVNTFVLQPFLIPSSSMSPTLDVGDRVLVNKLAYRIGNSPARGDVVVFDGRDSFVNEEGTGGNPVNGLLRKTGAAVGLMRPSETDYVKRVIGIGGDHVRCCDSRGRIEVNGVSLDEGYVHDGDDPSAVPFDVEVRQGRLWVMGDHRSASSDSRDHLGDPGGGTVPVERVIGRADGITWPVQRWGSVQSAEAGSHG
jgi:signal peptidase I